MLKNKCLILFLALILLATARSGLTVPAITIKAQLVPSSGSVSGYCPVTVNFSGFIEVNRACVVRYKFVRSDGKSTPERTLEFLAAGRQNISYSWTLSTGYSGWAAVEANTVSPVFRARSDNANFTATCTLKPQITSVTMCDWPEGNYVSVEVDISGTHLHEPPGKIRKILCDGNVVFSSNERSGGFPDTLIFFGMPYSSIIFWDHFYSFAIEEDGLVISNAFMVKFPILVEGVSPSSARVGAVVDILGGGFGSSAGTKVLKLGSYVFSEIVSWSEHTIRARVPSVPPGVYEIRIQRGSEIISGWCMNNRIVLTVL